MQQQGCKYTEQEVYAHHYHPIIFIKYLYRFHVNQYALPEVRSSSQL